LGAGSKAGELSAILCSAIQFIRSGGGDYPGHSRPQIL
jgi:hypothetical protein